MSISVAFIGLGVMGQRMLTNMSKHPSFDLTVAWDPNAAACADTKSKYPSLEIAKTAEAAITAANVQVVYIASPPASHRQYAIAAAKAGKVVYCEKPLGVDLQDSQALVSEIEALNVPNTVNFPFADSAAINLIESKLKDGSIGEVVGADLRLHFARWPRGWQHSASWLSERAEGGYVREVGSHYVFLVEKLFGEARLLDASVRYQEDPKLCETHFTANLTCGSVPVSFAGGSGGVGPDQVEFTVRGTKATYRLWDWVNVKSTTGDGWVDELQSIEDPREDGYIRMLDSFAKLVRGEDHQLPPLRAALSVQQLIEQILGQDRLN